MLLDLASRFRRCALLLAFATLAVPGLATAQEEIVLLTVKPKDPFSAANMAVVYVQQALSAAEARRHMRPNWHGPAAQHYTNAGLVLAIEKGPLMTRQKFVEATLADYEKHGGERRNVRIDVLSSVADGGNLPAASGRQPVARAPSPHQNPAAAGTRPSAGDCLKTWKSARRNAAGYEGYMFLRNDCGAVISLDLYKDTRATQPIDACYPAVLRPGEQTEVFLGTRACLHGPSVSPEQAMSAEGSDCKICAPGTRPVFLTTVGRPPS